MKGEKPPAPTRGLSKLSALQTDDTEDADEVACEDAGAAAAVDLIPRTDIRFAVTAVSFQDKFKMLS